MTIRRDLQSLELGGFVERAHGGALAREGDIAFEMSVERLRNLEQKDAIAVAARARVRPGQAVGLTAGATTWRLAHVLREVPRLTVITNSIQIANVLYSDRRADVTVVLTGGERTSSDALVGPVAVAAFRALPVDILFMSVHGITGDALTASSLREAETNQALIASADRVVIVADHTKWGVRGLAEIAPLTRAHTLISDDGLTREARAVLADSLEVVIAPVECAPLREA
jgi:DeoR/GlpR family transcriptional regulator of sugar metabolism